MQPFLPTGNFTVQKGFAAESQVLKQTLAIDCKLYVPVKTEDFFEIKVVTKALCLISMTFLLELQVFTLTLLPTDHVKQT